MQIGMIGLGRMGANMARRLINGGHECVVFDLSPDKIELLVSQGAKGSASLQGLAEALQPPRVIWVMLPAGDPTENAIISLEKILQPGDMIIDGGNTYFKDDVRRAKALAVSGIHFVDVGTSGGLWGLERGYCLMIGGEQSTVAYLDPIFQTLAPGRGEISRTPGISQEPSTAEKGYLRCGPIGSGHFVKMVHNGIEYGLMQAYAEGFGIMQGAAKAELPADIRYDLNLAEIAEVWRRGSVISSWLLDLTAAALFEDPNLSTFSGSVQDSGEGRWTVLAAIEESIPADVLTSALFARFRSRRDHVYAEMVLSAMRFKFGGHIETK
jgi:6-phosphogluconate dehydrogenase